MSLRVLNSEIDGSVNHVYDDDSEFRWVPRAKHDTIYLSSHTGCALGCLMCHLTTTGATRMIPLKRHEIIDRAENLVDEAKTLNLPRRMNFAFMARGDALASKEVDGWLIRGLLDLHGENAYTKVCISTIFPKPAPVVRYDLGRDLLDRFGAWQPHLYWSIYTTDFKVRQNLMPNAADVHLIADGLRTWQKETGLELVVHHPLIAGVNDSEDDAKGIIDLLENYGLRYRVNLVRYNPPDASTKEASDAAYEQHLELYLESTGNRAQVKPRVGYDVNASCGMFTTGST